MIQYVNVVQLWSLCLRLYSNSAIPLEPRVMYVATAESTHSNAQASLDWPTLLRWRPS
ncbi:hypothetical protein K445DRAFT_317692 [Daldinia sp. EC12]|nr:hypothetical protein K445DRAFT_317692 [Daldinia sp. EC12]